MAALNENYEFVQVRYAISREAVGPDRRHYDVGDCFLGNPAKTRLPVGTRLYRLDAVPRGNTFVEVWWMGEPVFQKLVKDSGGKVERLLESARSGLALPDSEKLGGTVIQLTEESWGWVGLASPMSFPASAEFQRATGKKFRFRPGGLEQVFLPNLHRRGDWHFSDYARLLRTFWLRFDG